MSPDSKGSPTRLPPFVIRVTANFTAEPIGESLRFWLTWLGLDAVHVEFSGYNQVFQELMASDSLLASSNPGLNLIMIRVEDWARNQEEGLQLETITTAAREFIKALAGFFQRARRPMILLLCPASESALAVSGFGDVLVALEEEIRLTAASQRGVSVITHDDVAVMYPVEVVDDPESDRQGHIPFTRAYWTALGTVTARSVRTHLQPPHKVIVTDADNTLWGGVVGEIGAAHVDLAGEWHELQQFLRERMKRGMLLALSSKNNEADVAEVFRRTDMALAPEDFVSWKINWEPKSRNLVALARELELGLDSFIFLDDNPAECAEVAANCPGVSTLSLPADPKRIPNFLRHVFAFDLPPATSADQHRTEQYRQQTGRKQLLAKAATFREFIDRLELQIDIAPLRPEQFERAAQLTQRTNQFNATGLKRTSVELAALVASGERHALLVTVRDRFGDYGEVGLCVYAASRRELLVDTFLLSCRVLGKGVEYRMLATLGSAGSDLGTTHVVIPVQFTDRNEPVRRFLDTVREGFRADECYRFPVEAARGIVFRPEDTQTSSAAADPEATCRPSLSASQIEFGEVARRFSTVPEILSAIRQQCKRGRAALANDFIPPRNEVEARLALIWEDVLAVTPIGAEDRFGELGGQSIQATQIVSRIATEFGVKLPLTMVFAKPRLADLAEHILQFERRTDRICIPRALMATLSPGQERLWFLDQFVPNRAAYNIVTTRRLRGPFDLRAWELSLRWVIQRHEPLRTAIRLEAGVRVFCVVEEPPSSLRVISVEDEKEAMRLLREEAATPFDLTHPPLIRCLVVSLAAGDHFFLINVHHIASDGWSTSLLLRELAAAYAAAIRDGVPEWSTLPRVYSDHAAWMIERLKASGYTKDLAYWKGKLGGAPKLLELPTDWHRPSVMTYAGAVVLGEVPAETCAVLAKLAIQEQTTPFVVLMAAFQALLHRYSGQTDILVGSPVAGRNHSDTEGLVGCFINTVVIRNEVRSEVSFQEHLREVRASVWEALLHEELPFERLVDELKLERNLSHSPLFQVMLVVQNAPGGEFAGSNLEVQTVHVHNGGAKFDLVLEIIPDGSGYQLVIEYNSAIFRRATIERMLSHFSELLRAAGERPELTLGRLPLMPASELHEIVHKFNASNLTLADVECLPQSFETQAARRPEALALTDDGQSLTYAQLNARANRLAHRLRGLGVGPDVLVGLCLERSNNLVVALLAILKAGGAYLPIDLAYPAERLAFMLEDARAPVLLTQRKLAGTLPATTAKVLFVEEVLAEPGQAGEEANLPPLAGPDHLAYVIYTSGTTGKPKGSLITHRNVARLFAATDHWFGFGEGDVWTLFHSTAFDFSVWEIWGALLYGGRIVVVPFMVSRSPEAFYELLAQEQVTVLNQTPSAFRQLIQAEEAMGQKKLALRYVIFGGEALEMQSLRPWFERHGDQQPRLVNMYGITETTVHVTYRPLSMDDLNSGSVIGVPIPDLQIYILDPQRQPVPIGVPGEMYVGGAGLARGYLNRPELTAERFIPDHLGDRPGVRLYRTGDLARFLPGRDIEYLGRIDQQVKIRGFRIELGEIESVICQHAAVREALVLAREDAPGGKHLVAYLVVNGTAPSVKELREHLKKLVPDYMVPAAFVVLEKFPLTNNGKIDRKALPAPEQDRPDLGATFVAPRTPVEETLAGIWAKVLRLERVGVQDNFFELGGDSILTIQIVSLARQAGLALSPKLLFQHQTVAELAASVTPVVRQPEAEQGLVQGTAPLTPIQHWFFDQDLADPHHYNQAFLFTVIERLEPEPLARALVEVERHHDALRLRMDQMNHPSGQTFAAPSVDVPLEWIDLSTVDDSGVASRVEAVATRAQAMLDFKQGPLWRAVYFDLGRGRSGRLLLAIHHLAVDGVSWRILIEDLERAYVGERAGQPARLPAKTTSVREWAERLSRLVSSGEVPGGVRYWQTLAAMQRGGLPVELNEGENTEASARTVTVRLGAAETDALLQQAPAAYNTQINDLLLAALGRTLAEWVGAENVWIHLEGHGREDLFDGVDLSRTVGWFTTIYPVHLEMPLGGTSGLIKSVKEQLRSIPARGIGFGLLRYLAADQKLASGPEPQLLFNYLGQFDQVLSGSRLFGFAQEAIGPWHSPRARRRHLLEVNCLVINGQMEFGWTYSENRHRAQTIEHLARLCVSRLNEIIQHCTTPGVRGVTPSDFPLVSIGQNALEGLLRCIPDLEDAYPLSPIQTLFYTAGANDSTVLTDHWHGTLCGPLDVERFQQAWGMVFDRHPVLRTSIQSAGLPEPLQVVHRRVSPPWRVEDWSELSEQDQVVRWATLLESDREQGMDMAQAPLSRLALVRLGGQRFKFLWTAPALLLDGWSWPLVFRELSLVYDALCRSQTPCLPAARPYRSYIVWLQARSWDKTEEFWRSTLRGVTEPTPLVADIAVPLSTEGRRNAEWRVALDPMMSGWLMHMARQLQLTPSALIQAAWALVLARLSGRNDVVFGSAFSGRPSDMIGATETVGPFVNNLPVRIRVEDSSTVRAFLQEVHTQLLRLNEHQFAPLAQIQSWSEVPWRDRLFDSIVVVQNYTVDETARRLGESVSISDFVGPIHSNFPLLILVEPEAAWCFTLIYDVCELPEAAIRQWGRDLALALAEFVARPEARVTELLAQLSAPATSQPTKRRRRASSQNRVRPQTELEERLARVWEEMLQVEEVSTEENLFDLGAHSLLVVHLHRRLCETFGKDFPLVTMFQFPTIQGLAKYLGGKDAQDMNASVVRSRAQLQREAMLKSRSGAKKR